jgi:3-hydroxyacyl-[acyl-carrier-protein] dehydratase
MPTLPDIAEILPFLPQRYPVPLIDRVLECEPGRRIRGLKNVTMNEPYFVGHFPGYPVMPGVLVLEALIQLCAVLAVASGKLPMDGSTLLSIPGIPSCRFKRQVVPGDRLILECEMHGEPVPDRFTVSASVDGEVAAEATLTARVEPASAAAAARP